LSSRISVIIPVYNDPDGLRDTLDSLVAQDFPRSDYEVIAVDNGSSDNTLEVAEEFAQAWPGTVVAACEDGVQSSYAARNRGIELSSGEILCFVDADMTVDEDWLTRVAELFATRQPDYVGFRVEITVAEKTTVGLFNKMTGFPVERYVKVHGFAPTCCLAVRRSVFEETGLFDSRLISGGDFEFGNRVKGAGYELVYEPSIVLRHPARSTVQGLLRKSMRVSKGLHQLTRAYPGRYNLFTPRWLDPRCWLPHRPWVFAREHSDSEVWRQAGPARRLAFYLLAWSTKLARLSGYYVSAWEARKRLTGS